MGAKGKLAKMVVFRGTKAKTGSGLKKSDLMKNKNGKIVSRKQSANGKKAYARIKGWTVAVTKAREDREPQAECEREEGLRPDQGLDRGRDQGAEVPWREGLRRSEEGLAPLQEGEGVLRPVSTSCVLSREV